MKLNKLNIKKLQKLFASAGLVLTLGLTGCASKKGDIETHDVKILGNDQILLILTEEESYDFNVGEEIIEENGVFHIPNTEILEERGLSLMMGTTQSYDYLEEDYSYDCSGYRLLPEEYDSNFMAEKVIEGKSVSNEKIDNFIIVEYNTVYADGVNGKREYVKEVRFDLNDGTHLIHQTPFINEENIGQVKSK